MSAASSIPVVRSIAVRDIEVRVATAGAGEPLLLLHGFPHTWEVWSEVLPTLAETRRVIAADLRGLGGSSRARSGYDSASLAADAAGVLDALGIERADVAAIDAGAPGAFVLAMTRPERVRRLVLMESLIGTLPVPGAPMSPPWWFGFHAVPGLAETVVDGHEDAYIGYFLDIGMHHRSIDPAIRAAFVDAYRGTESLRCGFEHYRSLGTNAQQIDALVAAGRLTVPTLAIGAAPVGTVLAEQLRPIADDLTEAQIDDCGHIIPLDRPDDLLGRMVPFLAA